MTETKEQRLAILQAEYDEFGDAERDGRITYLSGGKDDNPHWDAGLALFEQSHKAHSWEDGYWSEYHRWED
jgi:hypothetical protein